MIVLVTGVALIALGTGLVTGYLFARHDLAQSLHARFVPAQGSHSVPAREIERAFAGSRPSGVEPLAASGGTPEDAPARPGQGTSGVITQPIKVRADLPVTPEHVKDDPFTGELPKLDEAAIRAWEDERDRYFGRHRTALPAAPAFGVDRCEADVLAEAEAGAGAQPLMLP